MGLIGDLQEGKHLWKNSSWTSRAVIALSIFIATNPIASLSEPVFRWKGFILDGLEFYREWIRMLVLEIAPAFGLSYTPRQGDFVIVLLLVFTGCIRGLILTRQANRDIERTLAFIFETLTGDFIDSTNSLVREALIESRKICFRVAALCAMGILSMGIGKGEQDLMPFQWYAAYLLFGALYGLTVVLVSDKWIKLDADLERRVGTNPHLGR